MKINDLEFPNMPAELVGWLTHLWDRKFQERVWVRGERTYDAPFGEVVHFLYDDTHLSEDASGCIGVILLDETEADAIRAITANIDLLLERHGWQHDEANYLSLPEWPAIMEAARRAYDLINPTTPSIEDALAMLAEKQARRNEGRPEHQ